MSKTTFVGKIKGGFMSTLNKATRLPSKDSINTRVKKLVAYTTKGKIICSANKPLELIEEVKKIRPGVKYLMATKSAILNQGKNDFGWID